MLPGTTTETGTAHFLKSIGSTVVKLLQTVEVIGFGPGARPEGACAFIRDSTLHTLPVVQHQWNIDTKEDAQCYARQHTTM